MAEHKENRGRPKKFNSVEELENLIGDYFKRCDEKGTPYTIEGISVHLEIDRKTLLNYSKDEEFFPTIKNAKQKVLANMAERGLLGKNNPALSIFLLKNNYGYKDRHEVTGEDGSPLINQVTVKVISDRNDPEAKEINSK